jgi:hypothetical protein
MTNNRVICSSMTWEQHGKVMRIEKGGTKVGEETHKCLNKVNSVPICTATKSSILK